MSKQLSRSLEGFSLSSEGKSSAAVMMTPSKLQLLSITSVDSFEYHDRSSIKKQKVYEEVSTFAEVNKDAVLVFTDC